MRDHYDFSKMKGRKNPYVKYLKQPVTMRLDRDTVSYFKSMSEETGIPYQSLINLYLRDCAVNQRKLNMKWHPENAEQIKDQFRVEERVLGTNPRFKKPRVIGEKVDKGGVLLKASSEEKAQKE